MTKIISVEMSVGDRENLRSAKILTIKMQFIESFIQRTNCLIDDHYGGIDYVLLFPN